MCFTIPVKVKGIKGKYAVIEGGKKVRLGNELHPQTGDYLQVTGDIAVSVLPKSQGMKIRKLIKTLNREIP